MARYITLAALLPLLLLNAGAAAAAAASVDDSGLAHAVASARACGGEAKHLACPAGTALETRSAFYGRSDAAACGGAGAEPPRGGPGAPSGAAYCALDGALAAVRRACDGRRSCEVSGGLMAADPCPGVPKHLDVEYVCRGGAGGCPPMPGRDSRGVSCLY
jgi:hypothetical protein